MKKLSVIVSVVGIALFFSSCEKINGEGSVITQNRTTSNFSSVSNSVSAEVYYKQDNAYKVEIQAQQNILDVIQTTVVNNELVIKVKNGTQLGSHQTIIINVSSPTINGLRVSGSGNLSVIGPVTTSNMNLKISGSGNISVPSLQATGTLDADISGSGNINVISGTVVSESLRISGSGNINAQGVVANTATTTTSGSGETRVNAAQTLNVTISGSGSVYYKGNPVITTHISGSGSVVNIP